MEPAAIAGSFLSSFLSLLFDRMASREVLDFFKSRKLNEELLGNLKTILNTVDNLLDEAEELQLTNARVKQWLDDLKDAVYQADDLLDEIAYEARGSELESSSGAAGANATTRVQVLNFFSSSNVFVKKVPDFEWEMRRILERLEFLVKQKDALGLVGGGGWKLPVQVLERRTTSLVEESGVFGREGDKETIMKLVFSDDTGNGSGAVGVVPIVGIGGIGKTTLAQMVYRDVRVQQGFNRKAWICVSEEFDVFRLIKVILKEVDEEVDFDSKTTNQLHNELEKRFTGTKFFLVLDDVWNEDCDFWDTLLKSLSHGAQGSRILVTTRSRRVASVMGTVPAYCLKVLSDELCWALFRNRAFPDGHCGDYPDLEEIGREIVRKCRGLPLAANTLAGLLCTERDAKNWERILNSSMWGLPNNKILPSLYLSYHYLPSHLKRCFAYCAIFPKGFQFQQQVLVRLWMAEGLLDHHKGDREIEDVGREYIDDLVSRSLFLRLDGAPKFFVMHDLIHDLAKTVAGEFCIRLEGLSFVRSAKRTRHLSYGQMLCNPSGKFGGIHESPFLRTFLPIDQLTLAVPGFIGKNFIQHSLPKLRRLRVFSLSHYQNFIELPDSIGCMKHLRYLDLSVTSINRLSNILGGLGNLQILILSLCYNLTGLPKSIGNLKYLHYLDLCGTPIKQLPETLCDLSNLKTLLLSGCNKLIKLPTNTGRLTNLSLLAINDTRLRQMPLEMGKLIKLTTLTDFMVGKHVGSSIKELGKLKLLEGQLCIRNLQNVYWIQDAFEADLKHKKHLRQIELWWYGSIDNTMQEKEVLEQLQPHVNVECLLIIGYGGMTFPNWVGHPSFSKLVTLRLEGCKYCYELPPLGQLESLKGLYIIRFDNVVTIGPEFYGSCTSKKKPFRSLEHLRFDGMPQWHTWEDEDGVFHRLRELYIRRCPQLKTSLPRNLPSLEELDINGCDQLVASLPEAPTICRIYWSAKYSVWLEHQSKFESHYMFVSLDLVINVLEQLSALSTTLEKIEIRECDSFKCLQLDSVPSSKELFVKGCRSLESLCSTDLVSSPKRGLPLVNLTRLCLWNCSNLKSLPERMSSLLPFLLELELEDCPQIESFPTTGLPAKLESLNIWRCDKLVESRMQWNLQILPSLESFTLGSFKGVMESFLEEALLPWSLTSLRMECLENLRSLDCFGLQCLTELSIHSCPKIQSLPEKQFPSSLISLSIKNLENLESLNTKGLQHLTALQNLKMGNCPKLRSVPLEGLPTSVTSLVFWVMENLESLDYKGLQHLTSLRELNLGVCPKLQSVTEEELPASLTTLQICDLKNLKTLHHKGLRTLSSLADLTIWHCLGLQSLPTEWLPSSLSSLCIFNCPLLEQRCEWEGEDWPKISHIPYIRIGFRRLK